MHTDWMAAADLPGQPVGSYPSFLRNHPFIGYIHVSNNNVRLYLLLCYKDFEAAEILGALFSEARVET